MLLSLNSLETPPASSRPRPVCLFPSRSLRLMHSVCQQTGTVPGNWLRQVDREPMSSSLVRTYPSVKQGVSARATECRKFGLCIALLSSSLTDVDEGALVTEHFKSTHNLSTKAASHGNATRAAHLALASIRRSQPLLEIKAWLPSELKAISPLVRQLMRLNEGSRRVVENASPVEPALREAPSTAAIHRNGMDAHKLVHIRCRCERKEGVRLMVKDQEKGFGPTTAPDSVAAHRLGNARGRSLRLNKPSMNHISFEWSGPVAHMWKGSTRDLRAEPRTNAALVRRLQVHYPKNRISSPAAHTSPGVRQHRQAA